MPLGTIIRGYENFCVMSEELYYRIITFCCGRPVMAANLDLIIIYGLVRMTVSTGVVVQALSSLTIYYTLLT
jgi:hypothetical protein